MTMDCTGVAFKLESHICLSCKKGYCGVWTMFALKSLFIHCVFGCCEDRDVSTMGESGHRLPLILAEWNVHWNVCFIENAGRLHETNLIHLVWKLWHIRHKTVSIYKTRHENRYMVSKKFPSKSRIWQKELERKTQVSCFIILTKVFCYKNLDKALKLFWCFSPATNSKNVVY